MSSEIGPLNTYRVCGEERTLYHLEIVKDWQGNDVEVPVYDIPVDVRIAMAVARLTREQRRSVVPKTELVHAA